MESTSVQKVKKVFLGLPAYNEKDSIDPLFEKIEQLIKTSSINLEVLVYDDGCTDGTHAAVNQWTDRLSITYLDGVVNKGLGTGMNELLTHFANHSTSQDVLVIMDCDDTHDPNQIPQMIAALQKKSGTSVVIASRYRQGAFVKGVPPHRIAMSLFAAMLYKIIHPIKYVRDYTCGYRLYTHDIIKKLLSEHTSPVLKERGFACMVELLLKLKNVKAQMTEVPMLLRYDNKRSASKMDVSGNAFRLLKKLLDWRVRGLA
jgi:dolichol-phosphate mannosyltransferase